MGLNTLRKRVNHLGRTHDDQLVKGKLRSMHAALDNSYQAEWITFHGQKWRCLINPEKLTVDYDQNIISIDFESGMRPGDVFYWDRTGKHWIVYTAWETEEAYFRARIRKCDYEIDVDGKKYWTWVRGPVETALVWRQKHKIEFNDMNYSILLYVTKDERTDKFFTRFRIVEFDGHRWRVAATDRYSQDGVIEVYLEEYFDNSMEDAEEKPKKVEYEWDETYIEGPQKIYTYDTSIVYNIKNAVNGSFVVNSNKVKIVESNDKSCVLDVLTGKSTSFTLSYIREGFEDIKLEIVVQSL